MRLTGLNLLILQPIIKRLVAMPITTALNFTQERFIGSIRSTPTVTRPWWCLAFEFLQFGTHYY